MSYLDALAESALKRTDDGRRLFFPWGVLGRGYAVPTEEEFERLRKNVKAYLVIGLPLAIVATIVKGIAGGAALLPLLVLPYVLWARNQRIRLQAAADATRRAPSRP